MICSFYTHLPYPGTANDVKYILEYDSLGNNTAVKVRTGENPLQEVSLVQRTFTQDRRRLSVTETTGNGSTVSFAYDEFGRITSKTVDNDPGKVVSFQYGKDGRLEKTANTEPSSMPGKAASSLVCQITAKRSPSCTMKTGLWK